MRKIWGVVLCAFLTYAGFAALQVFAVGSPNDCNGYMSYTEELLVAGLMDTFNASYTEDSFVGDVGGNLQQQNIELTIATDQDLRIALRHLHQYCCTYQLGNDERCKEVDPTPANFALSPFYADHLLNVLMRKFDGEVGHCRELQISCETREGNTQGQLWRETINEIAEDKDGYPPRQIGEEFRTYRGNSQSLVSDKSLLFTQYREMCEEISTKIIPNLGANWKASYVELGGVKNNCDALVDRRFNQEIIYVRTLMVEKGIEYYKQNLRSYLFDYFIQNRFVGLAQKFVTLEGCLTSVLRYVTHTDCCNDK